MKLEIHTILSKHSTSKGQLVLVHGACMGAWCWSDNFLPWFAEQGYDVHAMSLRNHAGSEKKGRLRFKSVKEYADDIRQVVRSLPGPVYLVGHSMGGLTIQHYLADPDPNVRKAVLLCSTPVQGIPGIIPRLLKDLRIPFLKAILHMSWLPVFKDKINARKVMFSDDFPEVKLDKALLQMQDESFLVFLEMTLLNFPDHRRVKTPLLIVGGEKDYLIPEKATRKMAAIYQTEPFIVKGAPHNIMMEAGWELTAEKIRAFFEN